MSASKLSELKQQQQSLLEQELMREQAGSLALPARSWNKHCRITGATITCHRERKPSTLA